MGNSMRGLSVKQVCYYSTTLALFFFCNEIALASFVSITKRTHFPPLTFLSYRLTSLLSSPPLCHFASKHPAD